MKFKLPRLVRYFLRFAQAAAAIYCLCSVEFSWAGHDAPGKGAAAISRCAIQLLERWTDHSFFLPRRLQREVFDKSSPGYIYLSSAHWIGAPIRTAVFESFADLNGYRLVKHEWNSFNGKDLWDLAPNGTRALRVEDLTRQGRSIYEYDQAVREHAGAVVDDLQHLVHSLAAKIEQNFSFALRPSGHHALVTRIETRFSNDEFSYGGKSYVHLGNQVFHRDLDSKTSANEYRVVVPLYGASTWIKASGPSDGLWRKNSELFVPADHSIVIFTANGANPTWHAEPRKKDGTIANRAVVMFTVKSLPDAKTE